MKVNRCTFKGHTEFCDETGHVLAPIRHEEGRLDMSMIGPFTGDEMRTLGDILESAQDGAVPTHNECYYALLAVAGVHTFTASDFRDVCFAGKMPDGARESLCEHDFQRTKQAFAADPKVWLGPNHDPLTDEGKRMRRIALGVLKKVTEERGDV